VAGSVLRGGYGDAVFVLSPVRRLRHKRLGASALVTPAHCICEGEKSAISPRGLAPYGLTGDISAFFVSQQNKTGHVGMPTTCHKEKLFIP
jgi:hypothetical protein